MNEVVYLIFRKMRRPALVLLFCYAVAVLGMHLIPTVDENGEITRLTIFQSFYWISYTATTIGYGEIPVNFSDWQRVWVALSVYYTVPAWLYAAGKIIALLGDSVFQQALEENRFTRNVAKLKKRFVIICGFGEPGKRLAKLLVDAGYVCVVIDKDAERISRIALEPELQSLLAISGEAENIELLHRAGLRSPHCRAIVAITDNDEANIKIALSAKLLSSDRNRFQIICRTSNEKTHSRAKAIGADTVINSNRIFVERITRGLRRPKINELLNKLLARPGSDYQESINPPLGTWIICGYGSLGATLERFLEFEGIDTVIVSDRTAKEQNKPHISGTGTEEITLREAKITEAAAIVAAHNSDADNLTIAMTAKKMRPTIFTAGRQNKSANEKLFSLAGFDWVLEEADLIVSEIFPRIARGILYSFIEKSLHQSEDWAENLLKQIEELCGNKIPRHYVLKINEKRAPAVVEYLKSGHILRMHSLWSKNENAESLKNALPIMLIRNKSEVILPKATTNLQAGDQILFLYHKEATLLQIKRNAQDIAALYRSVHNREIVASPVLSYVLKKFQH
ncbi:MAG: NAD-binding protein [Cardiobacteriaceae bacterium]|nr:NAD-binding protein [Cardiobacteriaceae bacterium]